MFKRYKYQQLNVQSKVAIRLLHLKPGAYEDPLKASLSHTDIYSAHDQYTALSYLWGTPAKSTADVSRIHIEGAYLEVWPNLSKALRELRSESHTITLWVDALCVDQSNMEEKSHQIMLMTEIFSSAGLVHCWLGDATEVSIIGLDILSYLTSECPFDDAAPWSRLKTKTVMLGLRDILERDYFRRIWIVQEAALGRRITLQAGHINIQWEAGAEASRFLRRIKLLEISPLWQASEFRNIDFRALRELLEQSSAFRAKQGRSSNPSTWLDIVHTMRNMQSTDPRDKIYGLMGLASREEVAGFVPDYNLSWEETYRRFYDQACRTALRDPDRAMKR